MIVLESNQNHATVKETEICPTLSASMGLGGGYVPMILEKQTEWKGINGEAAWTIDGHYYLGCGNRGGREREVIYKVSNQTGTVRRLTPVECERLQGFPDGWTDIGEWVDSKGKKHQTADSARYKALGNSIALPFWFYLLRRISALYERPATLGSLFDGIGGFPLCWERCNGEGTAIWASEIEEFPIAVTKRHFPERGDAE